MLGNLDVGYVVHETRRILAFAYLVTALLFARSGLYAARALRPGLSRIVASLFEVTFVALLFALVSGQRFSSFYIFYGSLAFALIYVSSLRAVYEWISGIMLRAAGYRRRALIVGTGKHIGDVAARSCGRRTRRSRSLASCRSRSFRQTACARWAR